MRWYVDPHGDWAWRDIRPRELSDYIRANNTALCPICGHAGMEKCIGGEHLWKCVKTFRCPACHTGVRVVVELRDWGTMSPDAQVFWLRPPSVWWNKTEEEYKREFFEELRERAEEKLAVRERFGEVVGEQDESLETLTWISLADAGSLPKEAV